MPLIINNLKIDRISGPVSLSVLKPLVKNMPYLLIFGDQHFENNHLCTKCTCTNPDHSCCFTVWSKEFIHNLESISRQLKQPVDFYIEGMNSKKDIDYLYTGIKYTPEKLKFLHLDTIKDKKNLNRPMFMLREHIWPCYYQQDPTISSSEFFDEFCPFKKIRWNFSDPRQIDPNDYYKTYESLLTVSIIYFFQVCNAKELRMNIIIDEYLRITYHDDRDFMIHMFEMIILWFDIDNIDTFIHKYLDSNNTFFNKFSALTEFTNLRTKENMSMLKQLFLLRLKGLRELFEDETFIEITKTCRLFLQECVSYIKDPSNTNQMRVNHLRRVNMDSDLLNMMIGLSSVIMNFYFLLLFYKNTQTKPYSPLNVVYFGLYHTQDITTFLLENKQYKAIYTKHYQEDDRCLNIVEDTVIINF